MVNLPVAVHVQQFVVHSCISLVLCINHKVALTICNLPGAHEEESVLQVWVADFFTTKMNKLARLIMVVVWRGVGVDKISAEMHHQLSKELRLLVSGLEGQGTFVATPDVCVAIIVGAFRTNHVAQWAAYTLDEVTFIHLLVCFFGCFYLLLQRQTASRLRRRLTRFMIFLVIFFLFSQSALLVLFSVALHFL